MSKILQKCRKKAIPKDGLKDLHIAVARHPTEQLVVNPGSNLVDVPAENLNAVGLCQWLPALFFIPSAGFDTQEPACAGEL